jgi:hypothetical protein
MIGFVLNHARGKALRAQFQPIAFSAVAANLDFASPRHPAANVGNAEATFPILDNVGPDHRNLGIDDRDGIGIGVGLVAFSITIVRRGVIKRGDEQPTLS